MTSKSDTQVSSLDDEMDGATSAPAAPSARAKARAAAEPVVLHENVGDDFSGERAMLTIRSDHGDGGKDAVFVSHQGFAFHIPRDKPVNVPIEVVRVLDDAVVTTYTLDAGKEVQSDIPRYSYTAKPIPKTQPQAKAA